MSEPTACSNFKDFFLKDHNDTAFRMLIDNLMVDGCPSSNETIKVKGKRPSGWRIAGRIEQLEKNAPSPLMTPNLETDYPSATEFELRWPGYNPEEPNGQDNYTYRVVLQAENPPTQEACNDKVFSFNFVRATHGQPPPTPPAGAPLPPTPPLGTPPKAKAQPIPGTVTPPESDPCAPRPYCNFCVKFPHDGCFAFYTPCDGLLTFGEVPHRVQFVSRLYKDCDSNTYHGKPIRMGPDWWILQHRHGPVGNVTLVVEDTLCEDETKKRRWIKFHILDCASAPARPRRWLKR